MTATETTAAPTVAPGNPTEAPKQRGRKKGSRVELKDSDGRMKKLPVWLDNQVSKLANAYDESVHTVYGAAIFAFAKLEDDDKFELMKEFKKHNAKVKLSATE